MVEQGHRRTLQGSPMQWDTPHFLQLQVLAKV